MSNYLSTISDVNEFTAKLTAARDEIGSGSGTGVTFLKVDKQTGALTFGPSNAPLPPDHRFVIGLHEITYGYIVTTADRQVSRRVMIPMAHGPRPTPPQGEYGSFEGGGARDATEIALSSITEPGFKLGFTAWGPSNANRIRDLLDAAILQLKSPDGLAGFFHPVVIIKSGSYKHKTYGTIHHIDFDIVDWLNADGQTLLSKRGAAVLTQPAAPWDDEEDLTGAERELLGAAE